MRCHRIGCLRHSHRSSSPDPLPGCGTNRLPIVPHLPAPNVRGLDYAEELLPKVRSHLVSMANELRRDRESLLGRPDDDVAVETWRQLYLPIRDARELGRPGA